MKILVIGTGYVGLVTGVCYAQKGHQVLCVDADLAKVTQLAAGHSPIYESGLDVMLDAQIRRGTLTFANAIPQNADYDIAMIAVGTPARADGGPDLRNVFRVVEELAMTLRPGAIVATKSTVPVGTALKIKRCLESLRRRDIRVASVPEFLREGSAINDTLFPSRLIFGVFDDATAQQLQQLHERVPAPVVICSPATAEMIKYASNAYLATKISFINEIANICAKTGADVVEVARGMGLDARIGDAFLRAGLGYGGSCFPKDTHALVSLAGELDYDFKLLKAVVEVNQRQRRLPMEWLDSHLGDCGGRKIALLGVAFKPATNDVRESPTLELYQALTLRGARVELYDPVVSSFVTSSRASVPVDRDAYAVLDGADAAVLVTEWPQILELNWTRVHAIMHRPLVFDGRNALHPTTMMDMGFVYADVGRTTLLPELIAL